MSDRPARILLISGSTRSGSTNTALLRAAAAAPPPSVEASLYEGMTALPHFNPDDDVDPLPAAVADLRSRIGAADAVLFCTPEYAGALPGTFKNLLDWTVGGPEMYEKPVAWVNAAGSPARAARAHESLATVLRTIHAEIVEEACRISPSRATGSAPTAEWRTPRSEAGSRWSWRRSPATRRRGSA